MKIHQNFGKKTFFTQYLNLITTLDDEKLNEYHKIETRRYIRSTFI